MRDIKRIKTILKKFEIIWQTCPDMRFGQFVENFIFPHSGEHKCVFHVEDDKTEFALDLELQHLGLDNTTKDNRSGEIMVKLNKELDWTKKNKKPRCPECKNPFVKDGTHSWKPDCACLHNPNLRISIG